MLQPELNKNTAQFNFWRVWNAFTGTFGLPELIFTKYYKVSKADTTDLTLREAKPREICQSEESGSQTLLFCHSLITQLLP